MRLVLSTRQFSGSDSGVVSIVGYIFGIIVAYNVILNVVFVVPACNQIIDEYNFSHPSKRLFTKWTQSMLISKRSPPPLQIQIYTFTFHRFLTITKIHNSRSAAFAVSAAHKVQRRANSG